MRRAKSSVVAQRTIWEGDVATSFDDERWSSTRALSFSGTSYQHDSVNEETEEEKAKRSFTRRKRFRLFRRRAPKKEPEPASRNSELAMEEDLHSVRTSRVHVPDGKPLLVKQKAVVYCRPSLAQAVFDNGGSLSDSECSSGCSMRRRYLRQASRISALTTETPAAATWDPFATPNLLGPRAGNDDGNASVSSDPGNGFLAVEVQLSYDEDFSLFSSGSVSRCHSPTSERKPMRAQSDYATGSICEAQPASRPGPEEESFRENSQYMKLHGLPESPRCPQKTHSAPPLKIELEQELIPPRKTHSAPQPHVLRKQDTGSYLPPTSGGRGVDSSPMVRPKHAEPLDEAIGTETWSQNERPLPPSLVMNKWDFAEKWRPARRKTVRNESENVPSCGIEKLSTNARGNDNAEILNEAYLLQQNVQQRSPDTTLPEHEATARSFLASCYPDSAWHQQDATSMMPAPRNLVPTATPRISNRKPLPVPVPPQQPFKAVQPSAYYPSFAPSQVQAQDKIAPDGDAAAVGALSVSTCTSLRESSSHRRHSKGLTFQPNTPALSLELSHDKATLSMGSEQESQPPNLAKNQMTCVNKGDIDIVLKSPRNDVTHRKPPPNGTWRRKQTSNGSLTSQPPVPASTGGDLVSSSGLTEEYSFSDLFSNREQAKVDGEPIFASAIPKGAMCGSPTRPPPKTNEYDIACDPRSASGLSRLDTPVISNRTPPGSNTPTLPETFCETPSDLSPRDNSCGSPEAEQEDTKETFYPSLHSPSPRPSPCTLQRALTDTDAHDQPQPPSRMGLSQVDKGRVVD